MSEDLLSKALLDNGMLRDIFSIDYLETGGGVTPPVGDFLLMEDGTYLLLEDGTNIELE